ncbi:MAG: hypothetical protein IR526_02445 [Bordetella sp.]|nr:MAG: hypothetical protein IR526_02445 [Bordetella sp.]
MKSPDYLVIWNCNRLEKNHDELSGIALITLLQNPNDSNISKEISKLLKEERVVAYPVFISLFYVKVAQIQG